MYAGHFAAGLAIKGKVGPFVLLGIERASLTPGVSPGFSLDYIDWSHSLAMSIVWSILYAALFVRHGMRVMTAMGLAVFSHFVCDVLMHPADLALWPGSAVHWGFGLWRALPTGWWFVELAVISVGVGYYWQRARVDGSFGGRAWAVTLLVLLLHIINSPWLSAL